MKKNIIKLLEAADDPVNCEYPRYFDWAAAMNRVIELKSDLDRIVGRPFEINDRICNASYFAELSIKEPRPIQVLNLGEVTLKVVCLRFSCFGNFFTISEESLTETLSQSVLKDIIEAAEARGLVYIDEDILINEPYTGCNKELRNLSSWWERYFEYI